MRIVCSSAMVSFLVRFSSSSRDWTWYFTANMANPVADTSTSQNKVARLIISSALSWRASDHEHAQARPALLCVVRLAAEPTARADCARFPAHRLLLPG